MVMTSTQIAAMSSTFQQQAMGQLQHAGMISQFAGAQRDPERSSEQIAGGFINTAASIGKPVAVGGMMLAGVDPFSMGAKAAWGARGAGMLGAGAAGMAAAAPIAIGMMGAQYVGSQMMTGMQQQQLLSQRLRASYGQMNVQGGRGFTGTELHSIGQQFRMMSTQRGPGGEFATMDELGRLAANMGRMGMAQGVRNARDFNDKFRQMMQSVKEIATAFSTSLEQAQQIMGSMRGAGVFGGGKQAAFAKMIRGAAAGGGLAAQELSQIANIGANISRAVGGRGEAGAVGAVRALGRLGAAQRAGVISEEDIYNATGLTGAAGRQAFATGQMQGEARFFRSGLGRRMLAAVAGRGGTVNAEDVEAFMSGTVGTGRTMQMAYRNLARIGRADFIRNEGRLRGEAMRAFGGMGRAVAARGWLAQRGMDLYSMSDREMLFFQRRFKMDRDQADATVKMARDLDRIRDTQKEGGWEDQTMRQLEMHRRTVGVEGVKRKLEDARAKVQTTLQQTGADILESGRELIERFINKVSGEYVRRVEEDLSPAITEMMRGNKQVAERMLGIRGQWRGDLGGGGIRTEDRNLLSRAYGAQMVGTADWVRQNQERLGQAGFRLREGQDIGQQLRQWQTMSAAVERGGVEEAFAGGREQATRWRDIFAGFRSRGPEARLEEFGRALERVQPGAQFMERWRGAGQEERARIYGSVARGAGVEGAATAFRLPETLQPLGDIRHLTGADRERRLGTFLFARPDDEVQRERKTQELTKASVSASLTMGAAGGVGAAAGIGVAALQIAKARLDRQREESGGVAPEGGRAMSMAQRMAGARFMESKEGLRTARGILYGGQEERAALTRKLQDDLLDLQQRQQAGQKLTDEEVGRRESLKLYNVASQLQGLQGEERDRAIARLSADTGLSREQVEGAEERVRATVLAANVRVRKQAFARMGQELRAERKGMAATFDERATRARLQESGLRGEDLDRAMQSIKSYRSAVTEGAGMQGFGGAEEVNMYRRFAAARVQATGEGGPEMQGLVGWRAMGTEQLQQMLEGGAREDIGAGGVSAIRRILSGRRALAAGMRGGRGGKGREFRTIAGMLGGTLDKETAAQIFAIKDQEKQATALAGAMGIQGKVPTQQIQELIAAMKKGDIKKAEKEFRDIEAPARKALLEQKKEEQEKVADMTDPSYRALSGVQQNTERMVTLLGTLNSETAKISSKWKDKESPSE